MIGKIATLASDTNTHRSTLQVEVHRLVWFVGILAFTMGILLFVIGVARKMNPLGGECKVHGAGGSARFQQA